MSDFRYSKINFGEPEPIANRPETIYGLAITFMIISWIFVCLRLYVRFKVVRAPGWDDLCVILYLLTTTTGSIAICVAVRYGLGQHFLNLQPWQWEGYLQSFYVGNACYVSSATFIKEALLLQYLRVFERGYFIMRRLIVCVIVFTALWGLAYSVLAWMPCIPVWQFWVSDPGANCYAYGSPEPAPFVATFTSHTVINMSLDITVLLIPLPLFFKEGATFSTRMRLVGLLTMGTLVIVLAIWRLVTILQHQVATWPTRDPTWYGPISLILAVLEIDAAAVCASVPIFWPVLTVKWGNIFVTQEINITHEARYVDDDEDRLTRGPSHGRCGSDVEVGNGAMPGAKEMYYKDSYIMSQVDPLRSQAERVVATAKSDSIRGGSRKWVKI
ncbi:hypothetical protein F4775DRAFT_113139 [Biscogniauxia sp. FL1348]|nr:hypothetical protein F4775DRAFT_113139 [Biscogniauxia sp. FL1348]